MRSRSSIAVRGTIFSGIGWLSCSSSGRLCLWCSSGLASSPFLHDFFFRFCWWETVLFGACWASTANYDWWDFSPRKLDFWIPYFYFYFYSAVACLMCSSWLKANLVRSLPSAGQWAHSAFLLIFPSTGRSCSSCCSFNILRNKIYKSILVLFTSSLTFLTFDLIHHITLISFIRAIVFINNDTKDI